MACSGRSGGLGGNIGISDFIMDTGKSAVRVIERAVDRNHYPGGSWTVLDLSVSVPADSEEDESHRFWQSGGSALKPYVYQYSPEKSGTEGAALSAVCPADSSDSRAQRLLFSLRPYLGFLRVGCRLFPGFSRPKPMASRGMSADSGGSDRFFKTVPGRSFPHGCTGRPAGWMRRRDRRVLWSEENSAKTASLNNRLDSVRIRDSFLSIFIGNTIQNEICIMTNKWFP